MFQYPYMNLFLFTLFSSTLMAVSSSHWLMVWMSLELNMISLIPIISSSNWFQESEGALKYLLFQALGSSMLLLGTMGSTPSFLSLLGLLIKLGVAPFHFWFPPMMKSLPWPSAALLMTWQKIAPLALIISSFSDHSLILTLTGMAGAVVGGLGGITQTHFRAMVAYSSIGHMGWILAVTPLSPMVSMLYLFFYILISSPVLWAAFMSNMQSIKKSQGLGAPITTFVLLPSILSLGGLPPFLGFCPKLLALLTYPHFAVPLVLIFGSLINLSYYLNFFFSLAVGPRTPKHHTTNRAPLPLIVLFWCACCPIPLVLLPLLII